MTQRPHKAARPSYVNAMERAMAASRRLPATDVAELTRLAQQAFDEYRRGNECETNWRALADCVNLAEVLAEVGLCSDATSVDCIQKAQMALAAAVGRHSEGGSWTLKVDEMAAIDEGLFRYRIQIKECTVGELARAGQKVKWKVQQALAGNAGKGVLVLEP